MKDLFKGINPKHFKQLFSNEEKCYEFLANIKWSDGYRCRKCGNTNYCRGKKPFSRRCTRCKHDESPTAHTIFHNCRLPLADAFAIMYTVCCHPDKTAYRISKEHNIRRMTCWKFRKKFIEIIKQNQNIYKSH